MRDAGQRGGLTTDERSRLKALEREVVELKRANEILKKAAALFAQAESRPPTEVIVAFIDQQRESHGVESICRLVPITPSTYFRHKAAQADRTKRSARTIRDEVLKAIIQRIWPVRVPA